MLDFKIVKFVAACLTVWMQIFVLGCNSIDKTALSYYTELDKTPVMVESQAAIDAVNGALAEKSKVLVKQLPDFEMTLVVEDKKTKQYWKYSSQGFLQGPNKEKDIYRISQLPELHSYIDQKKIDRNNQ